MAESIDFTGIKEDMIIYGRNDHLNNTGTFFFELIFLTTFFYPFWDGKKLKKSFSLFSGYGSFGSFYGKNK